jgi:DNA polymerase type B, organellar and viral
VRIVGLDGEGLDTLDGRHLYTYLAAVDDDGELVAEARNPEGLTHDECMAALLRIPPDALIFGFSLGYDFTKMLEELPTTILYEIVRPEFRRVRTCKACKHRWIEHTTVRCPGCGLSKYYESFSPVRYGGRSYGWSPFSVADSWYDPAKDETFTSLVRAKTEAFFRAGLRHPKLGAGTLMGVLPTLGDGDYPFVLATFADGNVRRLSSNVLVTKNGGRFIPPKRVSKRKKGWQRRVRVWDAFKFFQSSFVAALTKWDVGTPKERARIQKMKEKRGIFRSISDERKERYCQDECRLLAVMMRKLVDAHEEVGLKLKRYDSPGSTASVLLDRHEVDEYAGKRIHELPKSLARAVRAGYFGGRFETSCIGRVIQKLYGRDINAAYPYALTLLPCLKCGTWKRVKGESAIRKALGTATAAICRFRVRAVTGDERRRIAWGPLPCRDQDGSIVFGTNFTGWAWWQELEPALRGWPDLVELAGEAWVYKTRCSHRPFDWMPERYRQRCEWGSSGKGLVMKNGTNSCYGKLAQSVGADPRFQSWPWAGMCTATTRGQMLEALLTLKPAGRWHVRSIATDGLIATKPLVLAKPEDTGTWDCKNEKGDSKVLGAWDVEDTEGGALFVKPGMHIPLDLKLEAKIKARGVGRKELAKNRDPLLVAWDKWDRKTFDEPVLELTLRKFFGLKSSIHALSHCTGCDKSWPGHPSQCCRTEGCPNFGHVGTQYRTDFMGRQEPCSEKCARRQREGFKRGEHAEGCGRVLKRKIGKEIYRWKCMAPVFGTWAAVTMGIAFEPLPKREQILSTEGTYSRLRVRDLGGIESQGYNGKTTPQGLEAREARELALDQEDAGLEDETA